jgi:hypothetical protein
MDSGGKPRTGTHRVPLSGYWSFQNLSDDYCFTMKVMFHMSCHAPGWEDVTGQCIGGNALSCG